MTDTAPAAPAPERESAIWRVVPRLRLGRPGHVVTRNALVARTWFWVILSGFFEPVFYLLSVSVGIGDLVGDVSFEGRAVRYTAFVAPALLASSAMNGAVFESTMNIYAKLKWQKVYDAMIATPMQPRDIALGELAWSQFRGVVYAASFFAVVLAMGLVASWWAVLAVPGALLIGVAFAAAGMAGTTFMRTWQDFDYVVLAQLPLFLFSATFYPLSTYPEPVQWVVQATPLYHGVALMRDLVLGAVAWSTLAHVAYLVLMATLCLRVVVRRFDRLLRT